MNCKKCGHSKALHAMDTLCYFAHVKRSRYRITIGGACDCERFEAVE